MPSTLSISCYNLSSISFAIYSNLMLTTSTFSAATFKFSEGGCAKWDNGSVPCYRVFMPHCSPISAHIFVVAAASSCSSAFFRSTLARLLWYLNVASSALMASQLVQELCIVLCGVDSVRFVSLSSIKNRTRQLGRSFACTSTWQGGGALGDWFICWFNFSFELILATYILSWFIISHCPSSS